MDSNVHIHRGLGPGLSVELKGNCGGLQLGGNLNIG